MENVLVINSNNIMKENVIYIYTNNNNNIWK